MPTPTNPASKVTEKEGIWQEWARVRPEIAVPGYWQCLAENCVQWAEYASVSLFWKEFGHRRAAWSNEFHQRTRGPLLARDELPKFIGKGESRIQTKIHQATSGARPPKEIREFWPTEGPPVPRLNDLVRTRVECAFLDGVEFLASKLQDLARELKISIRRERKGHLEGYFAQHLTFEHHVFFRLGGVESPLSVQCEVQIATQLATRVWDQSHQVYEQWREREETQDDWQWNPKDHRFIARQLGHMIHLADGLLVQLRDAHPSQRT